MINWVHLMFSISWIFGFAIIISAFSYQHWLAQTDNKKLSLQLKESTFPIVFWLGLACASVGFSGTAVALWESIVWVMLATASFYYAYGAWRSFLEQT